MTIEEGARNAVTVCMGVMRGERVTVLTDKPRNQIARALFNVSEEIGANPIIIELSPYRWEGKELPLHVAKAMISSDVIFAPTEHSISHTKARLAATKAGARVASMPGIRSSEMKGPMTADFEEIAANIRKIYESVRRKKKIVVQGKSGTEITMNVDGRLWITEDTGLAREKGSFTNLPAGRIFAPIVEKSANGVLVVDGTIDNQKLRTPLRMEVKKGQIVSFEGGKEREYLEEMFEKGGKKSRYLGGFGIGMNPKSKVVGHPLQDEITLGTAHFYIGENFSFGGKIRASVRVSALIKAATVKIGEITIIEEGEFVF